MLRKLLLVAGAGLVAKKLSGRRNPNADVGTMDRRMHRKGMPGGVRP